MWKYKSCWDKASRKYSPVWKNKEYKHLTSYCLRRNSFMVSNLVLCFFPVAIIWDCKLLPMFIPHVKDLKLVSFLGFLLCYRLSYVLKPFYIILNLATDPSGVSMISDSRVQHLNVCRKWTCLLGFVCVQFKINTSKQRATVKTIAQPVMRMNPPISMNLRPLCSISRFWKHQSMKTQYKVFVNI